MYDIWIRFNYFDSISIKLTVSSDSGRARPSQAEGQGKAETLRLSPRFQAELIVLYIPGRAEGRGPKAEGRRSKVRGPNDLSIHCFLIFLRR